MRADHMRTDRLREDDLCEDFIPAFISHIRRALRKFYFITRNGKKPRQLSSITIQHVKEFEEQRWECSNKMTKKNIISRGKITTSEKLFERSSFSEISDNRRSYERIVVVRS